MEHEGAEERRTEMTAAGQMWEKGTAAVTKRAGDTGMEKWSMGTSWAEGDPATLLCAAAGRSAPVEDRKTAIDSVCRASVK